jgi:hypothetical protein
MPFARYAQPSLSAARLQPIPISQFDDKNTPYSTDILRCGSVSSPKINASTLL